jgi:YD repeat-containing protein
LRYGGATFRYAYDAGNLTGVTRPDGSSTRAVYNDLHLPVTVVEADDVVWHHTYDEHGNRTATRDPLGAETHYAYDASASSSG